MIVIVQQLSGTVGLSVAQRSESIGSKEIQDLVEKDIPDVRSLKTCTISLIQYDILGFVFVSLNMCSFIFYLTPLQEYVLTKRFLRGMLKKDAEQRLSLSEILEDSELRHCLQNPTDGHWSDIL